MGSTSPCGWSSFNLNHQKNERNYCNYRVETGHTFINPLNEAIYQEGNFMCNLAKLIYHRQEKTFGLKNWQHIRSRFIRFNFETSSHIPEAREINSSLLRWREIIQFWVYRKSSISSSSATCRGSQTSNRQSVYLGVLSASGNLICIFSIIFN